MSAEAETSTLKKKKKKSKKERTDSEDTSGSATATTGDGSSPSSSMRESHGHGRERFHTMDSKSLAMLIEKSRTPPNPNDLVEKTTVSLRQVEAPTITTRPRAGSTSLTLTSIFAPPPALVPPPPLTAPPPLTKAPSVSTNAGSTTTTTGGVATTSSAAQHHAFRRMLNDRCREFKILCFVIENFNLHARPLASRWHVSGGVPALTTPVAALELPPGVREAVDQLSASSKARKLADPNPLLRPLASVGSSGSLHGDEKADACDNCKKRKRRAIVTVDNTQRFLCKQCTLQIVDKDPQTKGRTVPGFFIISRSVFFFFFFCNVPCS